MLPSFLFFTDTTEMRRASLLLPECQRLLIKRDLSFATPKDFPTSKVPTIGMRTWEFLQSMTFNFSQSWPFTCRPHLTSIRNAHTAAGFRMEVT